MHAARGVRTMMVIAGPPYAGIAPTRQQFVTRFGKGFWISAMANRRNCCGRNDLLAFTIYL